MSTRCVVTRTDSGPRRPKWPRRKKSTKPANPPAASSFIKLPRNVMTTTPTLERASFDLVVPVNISPAVLLKTKAELVAGGALIDVYVCDVPTKSAGKLLNLIKAIPNQASINLQHLRRVVKDDFLPPHLRLKSTENESVLHVLLAPTSLLDLASLTNILDSQPPLRGAQPNTTLSLNIRKIQVPLYPPASASQAMAYTSTHWPTVFTNANPFGPHPAIVAKAQEEVAASAEKWMALAEDVGRDSKHGEAVGCVVVERQNGEEKLVAVAGDGRWCGFKDNAGSTQQNDRRKTNVAGHAVMRAIAMIAKKRRIVASPPSTPKSEQGIGTEVEDGESAVNLFKVQDVPALGCGLDDPHTDLEAQILRGTEPSSPHHLLPNGYLCLELAFYITHEPCVSCSMALLHSRAGRVIFGRRMDKTGGMCADRGLITDSVKAGKTAAGDLADSAAAKEHLVRYGGFAPESERKEGLGYGLFWREELNWRYLAWEWQAAGETDAAELPAEFHA